MKPALILFASWVAFVTAIPVFAEASVSPVSSHKRYLSDVLTVFELQPDQAIDNLRQRLDDYPSWHRGRLELARLYYRHGNYREARVNVKQVVQQVALPEQVKQNILAFYRQILDAERRSVDEKPQAPKADWQFSGRLGIATGYDSNANTGPEDQDIGLNNLILRPEALEQSDHYKAFQLALRADRRFLAEGKTADLLWRNRLYLFDRNYQQQIRADLSSYRLYTSLHWRLSPNWRLATRLRLQQIDYDLKAGINQFGLEPSITWVDGRQRLKLNLLQSQRRYTLASSREKNGDLQEIGLSYGYRFNRAWQLQVAGRWINTNYRSDRYSYRAKEVEGQLNYRPTSDMMFWGQLRYRDSRYKAPEMPYYNDARDEQYLTARLGARYYIKPDLSLDMVISGYQNKANHKLHDYKRSQAELRLSWMF